MRPILLVFAVTGMFLGWNMPNHYPLWVSFHGELAAAVGMGLLFAALCWPLPGASGLRVPMPRAAWGWLVIALLPLAQFAAGGLVFRGDAALGALYGAGGALAVYAGSLWAAQSGCDTALRWLWTTVLFGAIASFAVAFSQWLRVAPGGWWATELIDSRPFGNFGQPNQFGLFMVWGIVAAAALFEMRRIEHRGVLALVVLMFGFGVAISQSRSALVAIVLVAALWFASRGRIGTRLRLGEVAVAVAVGLALHFGLPWIEDRLYLSVAEVRATFEVGPREAIWRHFVAAIAAHPWFGYGFGQGVMALSEVATQVAPSRNTIYAHNVVLDLATWYGVPVALALCAVFAAWMLGWLRRSGDAALDTQRHLVFAAWLALVVQSLLEYPFAYAYFLLPATLLAGAISPLPEGVDERGSPGVHAARWVIVLAAGAFALLATLAWEYLQLEDDFRAARFERYGFVDRPDHTALTNPIVLDQLAALNASSRFELRPGMPPEQIEQLHVLARRFHLLPTRVDHAKALWLNGRVADAESELRIIRGVYPPAKFAQIEREWQAWKEEHRRDVPAAPLAPAVASELAPRSGAK